MLKTVGILIVFSFAVCFGKNGGENYKLIYPKNIPVNSSFDISLITSNLNSHADKLVLFIIPDYNISIQNVELKSLYENKMLSYKPSNLSGYSGQVYKTVISLNDSTLSSGTYFQVIMNFNSKSAAEADIKFYGVYEKDDEEVGLLKPSESNYIEDNFIVANLQFYKPQKSAGKSIEFENGASLNISLGNIKTNNLLTEFWIKENNPQVPFLQITGKNNSQFGYSLLTNHFQMLVINTPDSNLSFLDPFFISNNIWYHISIDFSFEEHSVAFYCDGQFISKDEIPIYIKPNDLIFNFSNNNQDEKFQLDLLRFIDLNNSIEQSFSNRHYLNFISDSSSVISQFAFDNTQDLNDNSDIMNIYSTGVQYVKSDAPIFTRAPELNIVPMGGAYQLEWTGGDFKQANYYVLQKSVGDSPFSDIFNVQADNNDSKTYSYIDGINNGSDVIYYRVKQVNQDGGIAYSSSVKVGQGEIQPFVAEQNYPNPFNPKTSIVIDLAVDSQLEVTVYNLEGREITTLFKGYLSQGVHTFSFDATDLPSGVYLYKISTPDYSEMKKMILTK